MLTADYQAHIDQVLAITNSLNSQLNLKDGEEAMSFEQIKYLELLLRGDMGWLGGDHGHTIEEIINVNYKAFALKEAFANLKKEPLKIIDFFVGDSRFYIRTNFKCAVEVVRESNTHSYIIGFNENITSENIGELYEILVNHDAQSKPTSVILNTLLAHNELLVDRVVCVGDPKLGDDYVVYIDNYSKLVFPDNREVDFDSEADMTRLDEIVQSYMKRLDERTKYELIKEILIKGHEDIISCYKKM